jgi:hypothetical protein
MTKLERNKQFLTGLFAGSFQGHGLIVVPYEGPYDWSAGDMVASDHPATYWADRIVGDYEVELRWHEELDDDSVPFARLQTGTQIFASAFGCETHRFEDSPPAALPMVTTPAEADALTVPALSSEPFEKIFEVGHIVQERLGPDAIIGISDIQSPFDIAALIWRKEDLFAAMYEAPDSVKLLTDKCNTLLKGFLAEFQRQFPNCNLCHCPKAWAPPELGCWLSEDEAGSISTGMFQEFCAPGLCDLSETFGGLFIHCCAAADHQYDNFSNLPNLRGINRTFQSPGPLPAIQTFAGKSVLMVAWFDEETIKAMLDMSLPDTRFLFDLHPQTLDEGKIFLERMRVRCPRS